MARVSQPERPRMLKRLPNLPRLLKDLPELLKQLVESCLAMTCDTSDTKPRLSQRTCESRDSCRRTMVTEVTRKF